MQGAVPAHGDRNASSLVTQICSDVVPATAEAQQNSFSFLQYTDMFYAELAMTMQQETSDSWQLPAMMPGGTRAQCGCEGHCFPSEQE